MDNLNPFWALENMNSLGVQPGTIYTFNFSLAWHLKPRKLSSRTRLSSLRGKPVNEQNKWKMLYLVWHKATKWILSDIASQKSTRERIGDDNDEMNLRKVANANDVEHSRPVSWGSNIGTKRHNNEFSIVANTADSTHRKHCAKLRPDLSLQTGLLKRRNCLCNMKKKKLHFKIDSIKESLKYNLLGRHFFACTKNIPNVSRGLQSYTLTKWRPGHNTAQQVSSSVEASHVNHFNHLFYEIDIHNHCSILTSIKNRKCSRLGSDDQITQHSFLMQKIALEMERCST